VGSLEPQFAQQFFATLGHPEWLARVLEADQQESLKRDIAAAIATRTQADWVRLFADGDACVEPVLNFGEATGSALLRERRMLCTGDLHGGDAIAQINTPFVFDGHKPTTATAGAPLGRDSRDILRGLGYSNDEIEELHSRGGTSWPGE